MENLKKRKVFNKTNLFLLTMLAFPIAHFLVFWVSVNFESILMAFRMEMNGSYYFTFAHFQRLFQEFSVEGSNILRYLWNTLLFFPAGTMIGLPLSLIFSYFLYKKIRFAGFFRVAFFLPSIISAVALTMLFKYLVATNGPINDLISKLGGQKIDFLGDPRYSIYTVLFYSVWVSFGYNIVLLSSAMSRIPESIMEALQIDGAGLATELFKFVIPLVWPTVSMLIILGVANLFTVIGPVLLLTGGSNNTSTLALFIYNQVKYASENAYGYATAVGLFFSFIDLPLVFGIKYILEKVGADVEY